MTENRPLQERMKGYEDATKVQFPSDSIVVARIDGRGFSKFTKPFDKPFDSAFTKAMIETTKMLVKETCATIGYTQSDEISLIWHTDNPNGQIFFDGKLMKICSVTASIATLEFNMWLNTFKVGANSRGQFDSRVFTVPCKCEAINYLFYRQRDAIRNSISMAASAAYSHKQLMNKSTDEKLNMLFDKGIDFFDYPTANKIGTFVKRVNFEKPVEQTGETCIRSEVIAIDISDIQTFDDMRKITFGDTCDCGSC